MRKFIFTFFFAVFLAAFSSSSAQSLTFSVRGDTIDCTQSSLAVDILVDNFNDIGSMQFVVFWDETVLQFDQLTTNLPPTALSNNNFVNDGELRIGWVDFNPPFTGESLGNGSIIATIYFDQIGGGGSATDITLGSSLPDFPFQVGNNNGLIDLNDIVIQNGRVEIWDNIPPIVSNCPTDTIVYIPDNQSFANLSWPMPLASDNCRVASFSSNFSPASNFPVGTTSVIYTALDDAGNSNATCFFEVTVEQSPAADLLRFELSHQAVGCQDDTVVVDLKVYQFDTIATFQFGLKWDTTVLKYRSQFNFLPSAGIPDNSRVAEGVLGLAWLDFQPPAGQDIPDGSTVFRLVFDVAGQGGDSTLIRFDSLTNLPIEISKPSGVLDTSEFILLDRLVRVEDRLAPVIAGCPSDTVVLVAPGAGQALVSWVVPTATDNCGLASFSGTHSSGSLFPLGATTVDYIAVDNASNADTCQFTIEVVEDAGLGKVTFRAESTDGQCNTVSTYVDIRVSNFDSISTVQFGLRWDTAVLEFTSAQTYLPPSALLETTNTDGGEIGLAWLMFLPPFHLQLPNDSSIMRVYFQVKGSMGDSTEFNFESLGNLPIEISQFGKGILDSTETYFENGLFKIQDREKPAFQNCPGNLSVQAGRDSCGTILHWAPVVATDNCDTAVIVRQISIFGSGDFFPVGTREVIYVAEDDFGNTDTCMFQIMVTDDQIPEISCRMDTLLLSNDTAILVGNLGLENLADNCAIDTVWFELAGATHGSGPWDASGSVFNRGITQVTYFVYDVFGNSDTCQFNVTVSSGNNFGIACPPDMIVAASDSCHTQVFGISLQILGDSTKVQDILFSISGSTMLNSPNSGKNDASGNVFNLGMAELEYLAVGFSGDSLRCSLTVEVQDTTKPVFSRCPRGVGVTLDPDSCYKAVTWNQPQVSDNCGLDTMYSTHVSGDFFNPGSTQVTYTAIDKSGNTGICTFTVTLLDFELPEIIDCPDAITVMVDPDSCNQVVNWVEPTATDNCQVDTFSSSNRPGERFPVGVTTVTYRAVDNAGNEQICSFDIRVEDTSMPVFMDCPDNITVVTAPGNCEVVVNWPTPSVLAGCSQTTVTITTNIPSGTNLRVGQHLVVFTARDPLGNEGICTFLVTVEDFTSPSFVDCPDNVIRNAERGKCSATATWDLPTLNLSCGMDSLFASHQPGDTFSVGTTTVMYILYGMTGNSDTCSFDITVNDDESPVISGCPSSQIIYSEADICGATGGWIPPMATDNCNLVSFTSNFSPGDTLPKGRTNIFYTATDQAGNSSVCNFEVTVLDTIPPQIGACSGNIVVSIDGNILSDPSSLVLFAFTNSCQGVEIFYRPPSAADNCGNVQVRQDSSDVYLSGSIFPVGLTPLNFIAEDIEGNRTRCSFSIEVQGVNDLQADAFPDRVCAGESVQLQASSMLANVTYQWSGPNGYASNAQNPVLSNLTTDDSGIYKLMIRTPRGCMDSTEVFIQVDAKPEVYISNNDILCASASSDLDLSGMDSAGTNIISWVWNGPAGFVSDLQQVTISGVGVSNAGIYTLLVENENGCRDSTSKNISISTSPLPTSLMEADNDYDLCEGETAILVGSLISGNHVQYMWQVIPDNGVSWTAADTNRLAFTFTEAGSFEVNYFGMANGCSSDTSSVTIRVVGSPAIQLASNAPILCTDGNDFLELRELIGQADTYRWTGPGMFGSNDQNTGIPGVNSSQSGYYYLLAQSGDGCQTRDSIFVEITDGIRPVTPSIIPSATSLCLGLPLDLEGSDYAGLPGAQYHWFASPVSGSGLAGQPGTKNISIIPTIAGTYEYFYYVTAGGSCSTDTARVLIQVNPEPEVNLTYNDPLDCVDENTGLFLSENAGDAVSWSWSGPQNFASTDQNPVIQRVGASNAGTYEVEVRDRNGCVGFGTLNVQITEGIPQLTIDLSQAFYCDSEDTLYLETTLIPGVVYQWLGPVPLNNRGNSIMIPNVGPRHAGAYMVMATNSDGCASPVSDSVLVEVLEAPVCEQDEFEVLFETSGTFNVLLNDDFDPLQAFSITVTSTTGKGTLENLKDGSFVYTPDPRMLGEDFFTYEICYDSCEMLCSQTIVTIRIIYDQEKCVIPTVITPNNDGRNDQFVLSCLEDGSEPDNEIYIFNEWGDEVFRAAPYLNDWEGTYNGKPLPDGTYYYVFLRNQDAKPIKGFLTIFR